MKIDVTPELIEPCLLLQQYFHDIIPAVQRFLIARFDSVYQDLAEANTKAMLDDAKFYQVINTLMPTVPKKGHWQTCRPSSDAAGCSL